MDRVEYQLRTFIIESHIKHELDTCEDPFSLSLFMAMAVIRVGLDNSGRMHQEKSETLKRIGKMMLKESGNEGV